LLLRGEGGVGRCVHVLFRVVAVKVLAGVVLRGLIRLDLLPEELRVVFL
jgi:hypothetical protein